MRELEKQPTGLLFYVRYSVFAAICALNRSSGISFSFGLVIRSSECVLEFQVRDRGIEKKSHEHQCMNDGIIRIPEYASASLPCKPLRPADRTDIRPQEARRSRIAPRRNTSTLRCSTHSLRGKLCRLPEYRL